MTTVPAELSFLGLALIFFLPGYAIQRALFPEWRIRGDDPLLRMVEEVTLSFVLSVAVSILAGYAWLNLGPTGFAASWSDPGVEVTLGIVTMVALLAAYVRGAFDRVPPAPHALEPNGGADDDPWVLMRELEELNRQARRLHHALRTTTGVERDRVRAELDDLESRRRALEQRREAEFAL